MSRRSRKPFALLSAATLAVGLLAASPSARAYERQWHAGASFGYAARLGDPAYHGFGGGLHLTYGLTDAFNALAEVDVTAHPKGDFMIASGGIGAAYVVDILQWVPWVGVLAGGADLVSLSPGCGALNSPSCNAFRINLGIPFGLDYQVSRSFAVGVAGRFQLLLLGGPPSTLMGAFARVEYIWGW